MRPFFALGCLLAMAAATPASARAQAGAGTDVIMGQVTGDDGAPLQGATVEATSLETQVTRRAQTNASGRYTILFVDGGGQYRMTARAIGMSPRTVLLQRHADEDRLVWNIRLTASPVQVTGVTVTGAPQIVRAPLEGPTPGSSERGFAFEQTSRLPVEGGDLALLAGLVPGVLPISATDTTATSFSVAGLGAEANALTLDGLLFGNASIPQEGLRQSRVITSTYDVSRGQFSGGLVSSTTRSGSNMVQGSSGYQLRAQDLSISEDTSAYATGFTQHLISGGLGGPLVRDRLFWFASGQARLRQDPQQTLVSADSADYVRLGVSPDSVTRFMNILSGLGVQPMSTAPEANRASDNLSALLRVDYVISSSHTATLRGDWRGTSADPTRLGATALPQTGGAIETGGTGLMLGLTSRFGATMINTFSAYWSRSTSDGVPFTAVPAGRVQVASELPDSTVGVTTLTFGGNASMPTTMRQHGLAVSNELSWIPGTGAHRLKLGGTLDLDHVDNVVATNTLGTFTYNSLAELENDAPALFRRTLQASERRSDNRRWSLYAGDVWILARPFQLTYGLRLEGSSFGNPPANNPAVEAAFGRRTDYLPSEVHLSPRIGFTWSLGARGGPAGGAGGGFGGGQGGGGGQRGGGPAGFQGVFNPPTWVIRGGVGEFRSQPPSNLVAQAQGATGLASSSNEIVCTGGAVPTPDWDQYWIDLANIPASCGAGAPGPGGATQARPVLLFEPGFDASRAWRGSLAVERRLTQLFRVTLEVGVARGMRQVGYSDLNLRGAPLFTLPEEAGRPVYVAPGDIAPTSGLSRFAASRVDSAFGQVLQASSVLRSRSTTVTAGIGGIVGRAIQLSLSYTWQDASDQATGAGGRGGSTAGDPNTAEWASSLNARTHNVLATVTYPLSQSVELTTIGRLTSGAPFTPLVSGDVNADGSRNDRAFVFAPGTATAEAAGMQSLLASASSGVRDCLSRQVGTVAARNSCYGPWQGSLEFQLNWRPTQFGLNRRLTVSVVTQNFLRGLDELVHGSADAKGWGLQTQPDNQLLYVTGFDSVARRYSYRVNERFGATYGNATAFRPPFQIGINIRLSIGPDRMRQALDAMRGGPTGAAGGVGFRGPAITTADMMARVESALVNPAKVVLELRDSLRLDSSQVVLLVPVRDSLAARQRVLLDSLRRAAGTGTSPDFMRMMPVLRPIFEAARTDVSQAAVQVRAILTDEQWARVPENVKNFQLGPRMMVPGQGQPGQARPGGDGPRRP